MKYVCCVGPSLWSGQVPFIAKLIDDPAGSSWTRVEETSSAIQYSGTWYNNASAVACHSGRTAKASLDPGSRATFTFTGTAARWIAYRDGSSGVANVYIDGALQVEMNTHSSPGLSQAVMYTTPPLVPGTHALTIEVVQREFSPAEWIWIDAFEYLR